MGRACMPNINRHRMMITSTIRSTSTNNISTNSTNTTRNTSSTSMHLDLDRVGLGLRVNMGNSCMLGLGRGCKGLWDLEDSRMRRRVGDRGLLEELPLRLRINHMHPRMLAVLVLEVLELGRGVVRLYSSNSNSKDHKGKDRQGKDKYRDSRSKGGKEGFMEVIGLGVLAGLGVEVLLLVLVPVQGESEEDLRVVLGRVGIINSRAGRKDTLGIPREGVMGVFIRISQGSSRGTGSDGREEAN